MKWCLLGTCLFYVSAVSYDVYMHDWRNAAIVGGIFFISVVAGVLGSR